jgi:hypothetical protein
MSEPPRRRPPSAQPPYRDLSTAADVEAAWEARKELGPEYEEHIASGLADRVEELVAYRTAELLHQGAVRTQDEELERSAQRHRFVLGIISLGIGVPVTGIAGGTDLGLTGMIIGWAGIVGVNLANALSGRRRRRG